MPKRSKREPTNKKTNKKKNIINNSNHLNVIINTKSKSKKGPTTNPKSTFQQPQVVHSHNTVYVPNSSSVNPMHNDENIIRKIINESKIKDNVTGLDESRMAQNIMEEMTRQKIRELNEKLKSVPEIFRNYPTITSPPHNMGSNPIIQSPIYSDTSPVIRKPRREEETKRDISDDDITLQDRPRRGRGRPKGSKNKNRY